MALKRIDDKDGKDLKVPFYRVEIYIHKVTSIDEQDNLQLETVFKKQDMDFNLTNVNVLLTAAGQSLLKE